MDFLARCSSEVSDHNNDWRYMTYAQFRLVKSLCELSQRTVNDSIQSFVQTKLLVPQVSKEAQFMAQCGGIINEFKTTTQNAFNRSLDLSSVLKQGDFLVSGLGTNFGYSTNDQPNPTSVDPNPVYFRYENDILCSCYAKASCTQPVYTYSNHKMVQRIPGWRSGCYTQDALFASTFECYFNASCLGHLRQMYDMPFNMRRLVSHNSSRFQPTHLISSIVGQLFVDQWNASNDFEAYYSACAPSSCSYTINEKRGFVLIIGTLLGIWGGLTKALDLTVPRAVHFARTTGRQRFLLVANRFRPNRVDTFH
jgi:hypothetical protein